MPGRPDRPTGVALLLATIGGHVSSRFAERVAEVGLSPSQVRVIRTVAARPGLSQSALAEAIGVVPSRIVPLVDDLEAQGLVRRRRSTTDRRHHELHLDEAAADRLAGLRAVVRDHEREVTAGLSAAERTQLLGLLEKVAAAHGIGGAGPPS